MTAPPTNRDTRDRVETEGMADQATAYVKPPPLKGHLLDALAHIDQDLLNRLLDVVECSDAVLVREPETGLIMMTVKDSFDTAFHLGEVLVTTAEAECAGRRGYAMVMGDEPEKAVVVASVEAIALGVRQDLKDQLRRLIDEACLKAESERAYRSKLVANTRVSFESMAKEA